MKQFLAILLCLTMTVNLGWIHAMAESDWPSSISIQAESGIVIDGDSGAILWGQNIHSEYYPASITKIMTALLVIENCDLEDTVTFSRSAIYDVEANSSNAGISEGEQMTVRECLYALLLKSANEAANALAEHTAGSKADFIEMMNKKASDLGCKNTNFKNPSGLNDPEHYTSVYDMALISQAAFANPTFIEIDSTTYYKLPASKLNPDGLAIYPGHKMMKKNTGYYYPGIIGGKTGYTMLAGNTLVTCAERNGMKLITVILKGTTPQYWTDTKKLLDFGFQNFKSLKAAEYPTEYSVISQDMMIGGLPVNHSNTLILSPDSRITLPKNAEIADAEPELTYDLSTSDPPEAIAKINYTYHDRAIGSIYLMIDNSPVAEPESIPVPLDTAPSEELTEVSSDASYTKKPLLPAIHINAAVWIVLSVIAGIAILGVLIKIKIHFSHKEEQERMLRQEKRMKRLQEVGYSAEEFNSLVKQKRFSSCKKKKQNTE